MAVLDTGVAFANRKPTFVRSPDFASGQFVAGRDFVDGGKRSKKTKGKGLPLDRDGHGTHVAGTIAERTGNKLGLTGLAPKAKVIPVRVLDAQGFGTARDIAAGIRYAAKNRADVINMSFEFAPGVDGCNKIKSVCEAIKFAKKRGAVVVAAAGNSNGAPVAYPAGAPNVIGVGRSTKDACLADESRTGAGLDIVAPGGGRARLGGLRRRRSALQPRRNDPPAHLRRRGLHDLRLPRRLPGDLDGRRPRLGRGRDDHRQPRAGQEPLTRSGGVPARGHRAQGSRRAGPAV